MTSMHEFRTEDVVMRELLAQSFSDMAVTIKNNTLTILAELDRFSRLVDAEMAKRQAFLGVIIGEPKQEAAE